jgi:hypothetical protein
MARRLVLIAGIFLLCVSATQRSVERIVAVGDVHGDLDRFKAILQKAELIDGAHRWSGGKATLVQTGDLIDRGLQSRATLDFVMNLQKDAAAQGGSVQVSLGNHEAMNIFGSFLYVVPADYAAFADGGSEQRRKTAFQEFSAIAVKRGRPPNEALWMRFHPPGFVERREAFGPNGKYGKWLRGLPAIVQVEDSLFLHGGIDPELKLKNIAQVNTTVRAELQEFDNLTRYLVDKGLALPFFTIEEFLEIAQDEIRKVKPTTEENRTHLQLLNRFVESRNWASVNPNGPLWFRGYNSWTDEEGEPQVAQLLQIFDVSRIVVGHTPQPNGQIRSRFRGRILLIDTGMAAGTPSALEIAGDRLRAIYPDKQIDLN